MTGTSQRVGFVLNRIRPDNSGLLDSFNFLPLSGIRRTYRKLDEPNRELILLPTKERHPVARECGRILLINEGYAQLVSSPYHL